MRKIVLVSSLVIAVCVAISLVLFIKHKSDSNHTNTSDSALIVLLKQSSQLLGNSTELARQKANEALQLSTKQNKPQFVIQSMNVLGQADYIQGNTEQALAIYLKANAIAEKGSFVKEECKTTINIGEIFYNWGNYDSSMFYFRKALTIAEQNDYKQLAAKSYNFIGKYYRVKGDFKKAMVNYQKSLELAKAENNYKEIANSLNTEGKFYIGQGNLALALQCYKEAYTASEKINDKLLLADVCNHLGGLYLLTDEYEKSLEYHRKALEFTQSMNNPEGMAKSLNDMGKVFLELRLLDSAMIYFKKSFELCQQTNYKKGLVKAMTNMGKVYFLQNNIHQSETLLLNAYNNSSQTGYDLGIAESSQSLGDVYKSQLSIDKAISFYDKSIQILLKLDFDELIRNDYRGMYECYIKKNDYKKAIMFHELLLETEKKLLNIENNRQLAIHQILFDTERKGKDNQVLRKDNELKAMTIKRNSIFQWFIVALLVSTILLCIFIYNRFYSKSIANRRLEALNEKITNQNQTLEKLNQELNSANEEKDKLFSIIAHELRNPLYWFQNLVEVLSKNFETMKPEKVQKSLSSLDESAKNAFHLMDNLLQWSRSRLNRITPKMADLNLLHEVKESLKMFETIIQHKEIVLNITIPESVQVNADSDLLSCVIRNLVSNAIKYTPAEGTIAIACREENDIITVVVSDTGLGIDEETVSELFETTSFNSNLGLMQEKGSGLGLKLCKEFVEMNGGTIWLSNTDSQGTQCMFTLCKTV